MNTFIGAINGSTGASVVADEVSFSSATSITAKFTLPVDGTYKLYIENPDGNAVQTGAVLTVSDAPAWQTSAGSLGTFSAGETISTITITATNATSFSLQSGSLPTGLSLNTGSGSATITGTVSVELLQIHCLVLQFEQQMQKHKLRIERILYK